MTHLSRKLLLVVTILAAATSAPGSAGAATSPFDAGCVQLSPSQAPCTLVDKQAEAIAAECRRLGFTDARCTLPLGKEVTAAAVREYGESWLHRTVRFQRELGDALPILRSQFLGTHNSFNSVNDSPTISHSDSNQQLSLTQQLDIDMRSLELDVHYIPRVERGGASAVTVCHGRGPDELNAGCTNEPLLTSVLPRIRTWLNAPPHRDDVILLYMEDELGSAQGFTDTVQQLEAGLVGPTGKSLIYHPAVTSGPCTQLPLSVSRDAVRAAGAQVLLVGNCRAGWKSTVYGWDASHVESGSTPAYQPPTGKPGCDQTYARSVYDTKLVRYYEDSTLVAQAIAPTTTPAAAQAERLTPEKVRSMVACGVNLFGFDQILPGDGRLDATVWSWARDAPDARDGQCATQRADSRWVTKPCGQRRPAACLTGDKAWSTTAPVTWAQAAAACAAQGSGTTFAVPRTGYENLLLSRAAGAGDTWLADRLDGGAPAAGKPTGGRSAPRVRCSTAASRLTCRVTGLARRAAHFTIRRGLKIVKRGRLTPKTGTARFSVRLPRGAGGRYVVRVFTSGAVVQRTVTV